MPTMRTISRVGTTEDLWLEIAKGEIEGHRVEHKFGENVSVSTSYQTVWSRGGTYTYVPAAVTLGISSGDTNDTSAGSGARVIAISGLDGDYNEVSATVTLAGQTAVSIASPLFLRVHRMKVISAGSGEENAGEIFAGTGAVSSGVPANVYGHIAVGENQSQMAVFTIPASKTGFIHSVYGSTEDASSVELELQVKPETEVFQTKFTMEVADGGQDFQFRAPLPASEKSDVRLRARGSNSGALITGGFEVLLVDDKG